MKQTQNDNLTINCIPLGQSSQLGTDIENLSGYPGSRWRWGGGDRRRLPRAADCWRSSLPQRIENQAIDPSR
jgi:hypothetical protein